ncbi:MAG: M48 family metalloprotease, partial [Halocynthiibacter sp.]
ILTAAGLSASRVQILVLKDSSLNAFVTDNQDIFINSGLIRKLDTPGMLQSVIAHEAAHIANGHITRRLTNARSARTATGLGILLSAAVAASGNAQAAGGLAAGAAGSARRVFLRNTRAEESSADQSGARFLASAGVDPGEMIKVLDIFRGQEALSVARQDPYARTHPIWSARLRAVRGYAAAYTPRGAPQPDRDFWFARVRGKLNAMAGNPARALRQLRGAENNTITLMQRAVAYSRLPDTDKALENVNALISRRPADPYAHELKGKILLEARRFQAAVRAYARAVDLAPRQALILAGYGRALLALKTGSGNRRALEALERARARDPQQPRMLRDLALAYARSGNNGMASLATAERYALLGRLDDAALHAERASGLLARGSTSWNRAQDVLVAARAANSQRR